MSKVRVGIVIALVAALAAVGAGCGGDDNETTTSTPAETTTQATTSTPDTTSTPTETTATTEVEGDAVAGKTTFETTCQGCHPAGGTEAGAGPVLAGAGLTAAAIETQIKNGRGAMPGGLVSGDDLDNVTAFVLSIQ